MKQRVATLMFALAAVFAVAMLNVAAFAKRPATTITFIDAVCVVPSKDSQGKACDKSVVHILLSSGEAVQPATDQFVVPYFPQRGVSHPAVSQDKKTAGWLIEYDNCCTSYPLPLTLVVYRPGEPLRSMKRKCYGAIWVWHFVAGGQQVATSSNFPHGNSPDCYELFDVATGRLRQSWSSDDTRKAPAWVKAFDQ